MKKNLFLLAVSFISNFLNAQTTYILSSPREIKATAGEFVTESNQQLPERNYQLKVFKTSNGGTATFLKFDSPEDASSAKEKVKPELSFSPNPSTGIFKVKLKNISPGNFKIDIYNLLGTRVRSLEASNETQLNLSSLPQGIYFATAIIADQIVTSRIVKQ